MLKLWKAAPLVSHSHEELFVERYEQLLEWALRLTEQDHQRAEDLVHDAFVQFVLSRPNLQEIENLDGYLYVTLRNAQLSHARRAAHDPQRNLTSIDYDSLEITLRAIEPITSLQIQNELRLICRYACERKESSKAGSVLILRFFRGYYPSEIARILLTTRPVVARWLQVARAETRLYLEDPGALTFLSNHPKPDIEPGAHVQETRDFLRELVDSTSRRSGACFSASQLKGLYAAKAPNGIDCATLAHLVSCPRCLDEVNGLLALPRLSERYPTDTIDRDKPSGGGTSGGGSLRDKIRKGQRRLKETFEHRPKELRIAANGYIVGSQKISSDVSEQEVSLNLTEPLSFIEVFSDQRLKLLSLGVTPPPEGSFDQQAKVALSDDRALEVNVKFTGSWPTLRVVYRDPFFSEWEAPFNEIEAPLENREEAALAAPELDTSAERWGTSIWDRGAEFFERIRKSVNNASFWFRPGMVTAILAALFIAVGVLVELRRPVGPVSVADLLRRSSVAEEIIATKTDQVLHRTINLEERRVGQTGSPSDANAVIAHRKIEVWQSAARGVTARRLFDENGQLVAGDWRRADGVQTLYAHGSQPKLQTVPQKLNVATLTFENVWQLDPSAKDFALLIAANERARVEERADSYLINYESNEDNATGLVKASLALSRADLHASEMTLLIGEEVSAARGRGPEPNGQQSGAGNQQAAIPSPKSEVREYRFTEASFARHSLTTVAPAVFDPDPQLLSFAKPETRNMKPETVALAPGPPPPAPFVATAELEVEVLRLLNDIGADLDDQTTVTRAPDGRLKVGGIVASDQRKTEILRALAPVIKNPAVRVDIETVAEAIRREARSQSSPGSVVAQRVEVTQARMAAYEDLRKYVGKEDAQTDEKIRQFASHVLSRSSQAMSRAGALKRLVGRFSPEDLRTLSPDARSQWLKVVRSHARAIEQESNALRRELSAVFSPSSTFDERQSGIEVSDDASLYSAAERLFELVAENDRVVSSAFAISAGGNTTSAIRALQFWRGLRDAETLAAKIANKQ
jgi:RNA polymerase sigma factor (sigma-70 family)